MSDKDDDNVSLGKISVCSGYVSIGDQENWHLYNLLKDGKKKSDFCIKYVIKEAKDILDCGGNIDADKIEDLHNMSSIAKEIKEKFKEEEQTATDDPWINGMLIKKAGGKEIKQFTLPEDWESLCPNQVRRLLQMWITQQLASVLLSACV
eukprot:15351346-Ditylum_brightwellii.AAC.1